MGVGGGGHRRTSVLVSDQWSLFDRGVVHCAQDTKELWCWVRARPSARLRAMAANSQDVENFVAIANCPADQALFFLQATDGNFDRALALYFGAQTACRCERPAPASPLRASSPVCLACCAALTA